LCRLEAPITTTGQLASVIGNTFISTTARNKQRRRPGSLAIHPATRTFQAIRIAVNDELQAVRAVVPQAIRCLRPGGVLAVISFHSLEDRIVKWAMRDAAGMGRKNEYLQQELSKVGIGLDALPSNVNGGAEVQVKLVTRRALVATDAEVAANPRARSAKLRVVERL
jgi:16S rRNA (cytosine1402-N4)-methyltransferase